MNDVVYAVKSIIPVRIETYWGTVAGVVGTVVTYLFGEWSDPLQLLIVAMIIDYVSGVAAAYINPHLALNSQRGFAGILKKILILALVSFSHFFDIALGQTICATTVIWFYVGNEGLSIIENSAKAGVPIPSRLRQTLEQLTSEKKERDSDDE